MRRTPIRILAAIFAMALLVTACGSDDDDDASGTTEPATSSGESVNVCSDIPYEPFEYEGEGPDGLPYTGFDVDVLHAALADQDISIDRITAVPFDGILGNLASGQCDVVIAAMTITEERGEQALFSDPYFDAGQSLMVKVDSGYSTLADLAGQTIGVQTGTTGEAYANENKPDGATVRSYDGADGLFAAIESGAVQAILQDLPVNLYRTTVDDSLEVVEKYETDEYYGMPMALDNTDLKTKLDAGLAAIRADGTYDEIYEKYFGTQPEG